MRLLILAAALGVATPAWCQQPQGPTGWQFSVGAGALFAPTYEGDDAYALLALPSVRVTYGDRFFASVESGVGYRWVNNTAFAAGPIVRVKFPRKEDGRQPLALAGGGTSDLRGLGNVGLAVEGGGFVEYKWAAWTFHAEVRKAVSGHNGVTADLGAKWSHVIPAARTRAILSLGPRLRLVDRKYNQTYFGITAVQAGRSGLGLHDAGGGLLSYGVGANVIIAPRGAPWAFGVIAGYDRLSGDAAASPLVQRRGSENQAVVGLFASRSF